MWSRMDNNSSTYYEAMSFQMNSKFETNSCLSLNNLKSSNELSPHPVGQNSTNNEEGIYNVDLTPNIFTTNTSSFYSLSNNDPSYYYVDITRWVWPRSATQLTKWNYPLPSFNLLDSYSIHVGKKFTTNPVLTPFVHWQNALFIISAENANTSNTISWLVIDQSNKSITFDLSQINSVGVFNISMSAKMITYFINSTDTSKYTTINYFSNFVFSNDNCKLVNLNSSYYLVVNKLSTFMLTFNDTEQDLISVTILRNSFVNTFVQTTNNTSQFIFMLQTNETSSEPTSLVVSFTDSYHKDASLVQNITIELYLFAVDPPYFATDLQVVHAKRWSNTNVNLPAIIDPNGLNWTISLDPSTPAWVSLLNRSLTLNTTHFRCNISETTIVSLKITNEKNAWVKHNLTIETTPYISPSFGVISNIIVVEGTQIEVKLDLQSGLDVQIIDWKNNNEITWIHFDQKSTALIINSSNNNRKTQCAKLSSNDSWQNKVYSNEFTIFVNQTTVHPPILANSFGPLKIYSGQSMLFLIPEDLFISAMASHLEYSVEVLNWSVSTVLHANITSSKLDNSSVLILQSKEPKTCLIALIATDLNNQSAEAIIEVNVLNWASKDCAQWKSEYQADWVKCTTNYVLGSDGICLWNTAYFSDSLDNLFDVWGFVILIWLTINWVLIVFIEIRSLSSIEFAHTIVIFVVSSSNQNKNLMRLITWMQIFKFDFGFIDYFNIRHMLFCKLGTDKMAELQFYCQSTVLNYFMLLVIILIILWIVFALKSASQRLNCASKWYKFIIDNLKIQHIAWISIHVFWPFLWINLISDALNLSSHYILSLLSYLLFVICIIILRLKMPSVFTLEFVKSIDHNESSFLTLLTMLKSICHALLFTFENYPVQVVVLLVELIVHFKFIMANLMANKEKSLFDLYSTKMSGVKHSFFLVILIVISIDSIIMIQVLNSQAVVLMIAIFFIFWIAIDLGLLITLLVKLQKRSAV